MSSARASFFHQSIGGYSAVKPRRIQQLFDYQIAKNSNMDVLNMLNVKYIIQTNDKGEEFPIPNPYANGNAWFVKSIKKVNSADYEMKELDKLETKTIALINEKEFPEFTKQTAFQKDTLSSIKLVKYKPNNLIYQSKNASNGLAVFSEMYYKNGWNAFIDGKQVPICRVDYVLRGLQIPIGNHQIEFKFEPQVVKTGSIISLLSFIIILILTAFGVYFEYKKLNK
jgi:uncharacterized membrane protein YfhO